MKYLRRLEWLIVILTCVAIVGLYTVALIGLYQKQNRIDYLSSVVDDKQQCIDLHRVVIDTKVNTIYEYDKKGYIHIDDKTIKLLQEIDNL